jgi:polyferredoxin
MTQQELPKFRRLSQILFLLFFLVLMMKTESFSSLRAVRDGARPPYPVTFFLQLDPLTAITSVLATHALYRGLLWSLAILIPTFFLGRFFCGWICPLGTLNHFFSSWKSERKRGPERLERNRYKKWQTLKYYFLIAGLVSALFGGSLIGILDPISLTVRSLGTSLFPAMNYALDAMLGALHHSSVAPVRTVGYIAQLVLNETLLSFRQPHYRQAFFLGAIFIAILALNLRITRFWCRALCPLGALLGIVSRWSILGLEKLPDHCDDCNRCLLDCQGGDDPQPHAKWRKAECHLCFNCVGACPVAPGFSPASTRAALKDGATSAADTRAALKGGATSGAESGIRFKFFPATPTTIDSPNLQRRRTLTGVAAGAALLPILRTGPGLAAEKDPRLIRPPGALDETSFLARCIRCGECMKVCPNNALHPALLEASWEGLWTPVLAPRIGYCEPSCVLCGQVCPTGAIWEITQAEKAWLPASAAKDAKPIRLGTAFYNRGRCLPWSMATECIVCEEWCPTSPKAIYLRPVEVTDSLGSVKQIRQPYVDPDRCVGCGACEFACPVKDQPAIYVTSIGESRSKTNQILLNRQEGSPRSEVRGPRQ